MMLSTTPREPVAAPLTTFNTETSDSNAPFLAFDERDEEHGLDFTQAGYNYMRAA